MKFRLIPTRGTRTPSRDVYVEAQDEAEYEGERMAAELKMPVLVCFVAANGATRALCTVGEIPDEKPKRRVR